MAPDTPPPSPRRPLWRSAAIRGLRGSIAFLDWLAGELEADAPLPPPSFDRLGESARAAQSGLARALGWLGQRLWQGVRDRLPASLQKLSDRNLGLVLSGTSVFLIWVSLALLSPQLAELRDQFSPDLPPQPPAIAAEPTAAPSPSPSPNVPADLPVDLPLEQPADEPTSPPEPTPNPEASQGETPPAAVALDRQPEDGLIASIQAQLSELVARSGAGSDTSSGQGSLVQSVRAEFASGRLVVALDAVAWDALSPERQDRLARDLLARSRQLDFAKLELRSNDGTLLARSPLVGDNPVIFASP